MNAIGRLVEVVQHADQFKQQQLATTWPELAEAVAGVIEGMTDQDAPREWWTTPADAGEVRVYYPPCQCPTCLVATP